MRARTVISRAGLLHACLALVVSCGLSCGRPRHAEVRAAAVAEAAPTPGPLPLIPWPEQVRRGAGELALPASPTICAPEDPDAAGVAALLAEALAGQVGASSCTVKLELSPPPPSASQPPLWESRHTLDVDPRGIVLRAAAPRGLFYASQTLLQLVSRDARVPFVHIADAPRFGWRGLHLDVARHFFSRAFVERLIDLMALHKLNVLHLHLTDDQGWRLEIRSHPELTRVGARREGDETPKFYTQDDIRRLVAHARRRFVMVVPEIEMPGHARAVLAAHPELGCEGKPLPVPTTWGVFDDVLCAGDDAVFALLDDVLAEVAALFPAPYVHVGGDEVPTTRWAACPRCRARMQAAKLTRPEELAGYFLRRVSATLRARGRRLVGWDEIVDAGLPDDATVMSWRGVAGGERAARAGHDVVMAPEDVVYFNRGQAGLVDEPGYPGDLSWARVLAFDPVPDGLDARARSHVIGVEGALWSEGVQTPEEAELLLFPRVSALAEVAWTAPRVAHRDLADFADRFGGFARLLDARRVAWFVPPPTGLAAQRVFLDDAELVLAPPALLPQATVRYTLDGSDPTRESPRWTSPVKLARSARVVARTFLPSGRSSLAVRGLFDRETPRAAATLARSRPGAVFRYLEGAFASVADIAGKPHARAGIAPSIDLARASRPGDYALEFRGHVVVPASGVYRFSVTSDDGSALEIDGRRIVDNDGTHPPREVSGEIALAPGPHPLRLVFFQGGGGAALAVLLEGPGLSRRELGGEALVAADDDVCAAKLPECAR